MEIKADLHYHPSFFTNCQHPRLSEKRAPTLDEIVRLASKRGIDVLAITSCSNYSARDNRWKDYFGKDEPFHNYSRGNKNILFVRGQEFKTDKLDVNVLFAEGTISPEGSTSQKSKFDFYCTLDAAKNAGDNVVVLVQNYPFGLTRSDCGSKINPRILEKLYESGKIDGIEAYNSMDPIMVSSTRNIPGIAVSDGHSLNDLGWAYTKFVIPLTEGYQNPELTMEQIKDRIRTNNFDTFKRSLPMSSKLAYTLKLSEAIIRAKFSSFKI